MSPPPDWSSTEQALWNAVHEGRSLDLAPRSGQLAADDDLREVSASALASLILNPPAASAGIVTHVHLVRAHVTGELRLANADVKVPVSLINCRFDQPVNLGDAVMRSLDLSGSQLPALGADGARISGDLLLAELACDELSLLRAEIDGNMWLVEARVGWSPAETAVHGAQLRIRGGLYARGLGVTGQLNLWGAQAFSVELDEAEIASTHGPAIRADGLRVSQDLSCAGMSIVGGLALFDAHVGGQFWLSGTTVRSGADGHEAIHAPSLTVDGGLYARELVADGGLGLFGAKIGESLELHGSHLTSSDGHALRALGLTVERDLVFDNKTEITGTVELSDTTVKGTLTAGGRFAGDAIVSLRQARIGVLDLTAVHVQPARLDLRAAAITTIRDAPDTWPQRLDLDSLTYEVLDPATPVASRLAWLNRGDLTYQPQPYEQLAAHYRRLGHDDDARTVLLARHRHRRRTRRLPGRLWEHLEDLIVGYGYRPGRALAWLCGLIALVATIFVFHQPRPLGTNGPAFQPVAYALDLILPILDLGQERAFTPVGLTRWVAWAATLAGWLLATTVIAGITRRLNRA